MTALRNSLVIGAAILLHAARAAQPTVKLTPDVIRMGAFYSGEWMRISGTIEQGSKVVVVIRGSDTEEIFNKKGRVGPIWVNTGKVHISGVPSLFLCYSTEPVDKLLTRAEIEKRQLDDTSIERQMTVLPKELDLPIIRRDFVALKRQENIYRMIVDDLTIGAPTEAGVPYSLRFHWPRKAPPAHYEVRVYECRGGVIVGRVGAPLEVVKIGFPAAMAALATEHDSLYGIIAVLVAVIVGFGIDFLAAGLRRKLRRSPPDGGHAADQAEPKKVGKGVGIH
jgi:uncharacterized protein (TIGR02186 family)